MGPPAAALSVKPAAGLPFQLPEHAAASASRPAGLDLGWRTDFSSTYLAGKMIGSGSFGQVGQRRTALGAASRATETPWPLVLHAPC